jgi:hypothetical protein
MMAAPAIEMDVVDESNYVGEGSASDEARVSIYRRNLIRPP